MNKKIIDKMYCYKFFSFNKHWFHAIIWSGEQDKKEVRSIKDNVTKRRERIPVRYMLMNILDAHYEFLQRNPDLKISSSFVH